MPEGEPEPSKYWISNLPEQTSLRELVYWAKLRWWVEQNYGQLKQEVGLDTLQRKDLGGLAPSCDSMQGSVQLPGVGNHTRKRELLGGRLPQVRWELQKMLIGILGVCPLCRRRYRVATIT